MTGRDKRTVTPDGGSSLMPKRRPATSCHQTVRTPSRSQSRGRRRSRSRSKPRVRQRRSKSRRSRCRASRSITRRSDTQRSRSRRRAREATFSQRYENDSAKQRSRSRLTKTRRDSLGSQDSSSFGRQVRSSRVRKPINDRDENSMNNQNLLLEKFMEFMTTMKGAERERLPMLNNVIPEFEPMRKEQSVDVWICKVEECAQIYNWNDKHIVHYALPKLTGVAKTWYEGLPSVLYSWSEWKVKLRESFPSRINYAELLTEMLNRKGRFGESLELYYFDKINLLNRCEIKGISAVDCLIFGIEDRGIRLGAQAAEFTEPEQVLKFFKSVKPGHNKSTTEVNKIRHNSTQMNNNNVAPSSLKGGQSQKPDNTTNNIVCYNCNEIGHPFSRCPKPKVSCTNCNLRGHVFTDCPKIKKDNLN